tara:strand:+ start:186 stop:542 length:357 start_codon:yes stop_codon:yes gene_type:complete
MGNNNSHCNVANKRIEMKTKEIIKGLLLKYPELKDSDNKLIANYWNLELQSKNKDIDDMSARELLRMYANSKLTNAETIRRMRAKLQEEVPELRGGAYELRKGTIQDKWRKDLGYENN